MHGSVLMNAHKSSEFKQSNGMEIGLYSVGDYFSSVNSPLSEKQRLKNLIEIAKLAEQAGLDVFQLGESHQKNFVSQAHLIILAAIASQTSHIKIASGATILGAWDPVRLIQQARTIDLLSDERMELVCGRSARMGVFDLFGYHLDDYEEVFEEKFDLLLKLNQSSTVTWSGQFREPIDNVDLLPQSERSEGSLPIWRANSGTLESAIHAAKTGVPLHLMQLRGSVNHYKTLINQYRQAGRDSGYGDLPVATAGFLMAKIDDQSALESYKPLIKDGMFAINDADFDDNDFSNYKQMDNVMMIGSPELIVEKLLYQHEMYNNTRYVGQIDFGGLSLDDIKETIDLLGTKIIPQVKKYTK